MRLDKQPKLNDSLLNLFYELGDGGIITIPAIKEQFHEDFDIHDRLRYFHARGFIKNVAPYTLEIEKPAIVFYNQGGFLKEWKNKVWAYWYDILKLLVSGIIGGLIALAVRKIPM